VQIARKVQLFLDHLALGFGQVIQVTSGRNENGETLALKIIGDPLPTPDDGGSGGVVRYVYEDLFTGIVAGAVDFVRGLAEGKFAQSSEGLLLKEILHRLLGFVG
jgi:hypothetical protein